MANHTQPGGLDFSPSNLMQVDSTIAKKMCTIISEIERIVPQLLTTIEEYDLAGKGQSFKLT